jgi:two-component system chemotaxis response regulator CheB
MMKARRLIVIGASLGGVEALRTITAQLPADFPAALLVVLHVGTHKSELPWLLNRDGPLLAIHPENGEPITPGRIYVAPPDHHMVVGPGRVYLTRGPRENWARPAIDPLFRTAARSYGPAVIGVILTGRLNDGTAGLHEIKQQGGTAIVQDPADATAPSMPLSALRHVPVDHCLPLTGIPRLLARLAAESPAEISTTERKIQKMSETYTLDQPFALTCPECGGALRRSELGTLTRYRCHIGHVVTSEVMAVAQFVTFEKTLDAALRLLNERVEFCRQMSQKAQAAGQIEQQQSWQRMLRECEERAVTLQAFLEQEWVPIPGTPDAVLPEA